MSEVKKNNEFDVTLDETNEELDLVEDLEIEDEKEEKLNVYPCIPLRGVSIFSHVSMHFDIGREKSLEALEAAVENGGLLFVSTQKDDSVLIPTADDIYKLGAVVKIKQMLKIAGNSVRVLVEGVKRAEFVELWDNESYMEAKVVEFEDTIDRNALSIEDNAKLRVLSNKFVKFASLTNQISEDAVDVAINEEEPAALVNKICLQMPVKYSVKQEIYETEPFVDRLEKLIELISFELSLAAEESIINRKFKQNIDQSQKEYYLKERMKVIQEELGMDEDPNEDANNWTKQLTELKLDEKIEEKVLKEIKRYQRMAPSSAESAVIRTYVETILELPWNESSKLNNNLKKAEKILDRDHYGLDKIKERIIEYLAVIHLSKAIKGPILCLVGPPGVGKTSIAKSIASATGREFFRMSLGGVRDEAEIRGHRRTYIGAIPGSIINGIKTAGTNNPVFLFDEIDKIGADFKGDPASALLEVLDPEQNKTFTDHYLEVPFDLSKVLFITTANSLDTIPRPLLDRMEVIEVSGYTEDEKVKIAQKYLIPKKVQEHGMKKETLKISETALRDIINYYTRESGVRNLEREIANICRKVAKTIVTTKKKTFSITPRNLEKYLGKKKYRFDTVEGVSEVGVVTGMAWTTVGGDTLSIETAVLPGTGKLQLTGQLGDVMQESAKTGVSYIRSISEELDILKDATDFYKEKDLHIHVPEGAVPKDGPSAGVTIFTSVISALTDIPVRKDVAMTGEITLRGKVLPVGGIKEKVLAAHRAGIKKILLPKDNLVDLEEIPNNVRKQLEFVPLSYAKETLEHALDVSKK